MISLIIADEAPIYRNGFRYTFNCKQQFNILGEAETGRQLLLQLDRYKPNVIILDLELPNISGEQALDLIRIKYPSLKIVLTTANFYPPHFIHYYKRGANAYISKLSPPEQFIGAVKKVINNGIYVSEELGSVFIQNLTQANKNKTEELTYQELTILRHICNEKSNKEIAEILNIVVRTVDFHRKNIYNKIGAKTVAGLIKYAVRKGIVKFPLTKRT